MPTDDKKAVENAEERNPMRREQEDEEMPPVEQPPPAPPFDPNLHDVTMFFMREGITRLVFSPSDHPFAVDTLAEGNYRFNIPPVQHQTMFRLRLVVEEGEDEEDFFGDPTDDAIIEEEDGTLSIPLIRFVVINTQKLLDMRVVCYPEDLPVPTGTALHTTEHTAMFAESDIMLELGDNMDAIAIEMRLRH